MPDEVTDDSNICYYFSKTATCRYFGRCTKSHPRPTLSTAILIPNFFSHFKLEKSVRDEYDSDIGLEYEDTELYNEFLEFYDDVVPELRKSGTLLQFKVCCNLEPHLRGNVYVQYQTIRESIEVFRKFNGRFYNGRQLSLQFIKVDSWRSAICGSFLRKACIKGRTCNYLHVFRNPTKEFVQADRDWKEYQHPSKVQSKISNSISSTPARAAFELNSTPALADQVNETENRRSKTRTEEVTSRKPEAEKSRRSSSKNRKLVKDSLSSSHSVTKSKSDSNSSTNVKTTRTKHSHAKSFSDEIRHRKKHKNSSSHVSSLSPKKSKKLKSKKKKEKKSKKRKKSKHTKEK